MSSALPGGNGCEPEAELRLLVVDYLEDAAEGARTAWSAGHRVARVPVPALEACLGSQKASRVRNGVFLVVLGPAAGDGALRAVTAVLRRAPITSPEGLVMLSDWPPGAPTYRRVWVARDAAAAPEPEGVTG